MNIWRNDELNHGVPTISSVIVTADDILEETGPYSLHIQHVRSFHGRGFMPVIHSGGHDQQNGKVSIGQDQEAYDQAVASGRELVQRKLVEDEAFLEEMKKGFERKQKE